MQNNSAGDKGPPLTDDDFANLETSLSVTLPEQYRRLMAAYPFGDYSRPAQAYVPDNANYICSLNKQIRADAVYGDVWRPHFFAVGTTYGGDAYFLDTTLGDSPVFKVTQQVNAVSEVAATLNSWFTQLKHWHIDFSRDSVAQEYSAISAAVQAAGFFTTSPEPMDGWHRISIASKRRQQGGLSGNSFWVAPIRENWFVGAWGGHVYRVLGDICDFCVTWLSRVPDETRADFDPEIKKEFKLQSLAKEEFDAVIQVG